MTEGTFPADYYRYINITGILVWRVQSLLRIIGNYAREFYPESTGRGK